VPATSFYTAPDVVGFSAVDMSDTTPHFYTRWSNPTVAVLEARLSALEDGAGAVCYATGMAALTALFLSRLKADEAKRPLGLDHGRDRRKDKRR
jgi:cystathionine gamma-synthase